MSKGSLSQAQLSAALAGDQTAMGELMARITPVIHRRVARVLRATAAAYKRDPQGEAADLAQDVFVTLFADGARVLRTWREDGGLSLPNFVGLVAERRALSVLRGRCRGPYYREEPEEDLSATASPAPCPERSAAKRSDLARLHTQLRQTVSPLSLDIFYRLFVHEQSVEEVCKAKGITAAALYVHRHRLKQAAKRAAQHTEPPASRRMSDGRRAAGSLR